MNQKNRIKTFDSWNVGPNLSEKKITVIEIVKKFLVNFEDKVIVKIKKSKINEAQILMLNSNKIRKKLNWRNYYNLNSTIKEISQWYKLCAKKNNNKLKNISQEIMKNYLKKI